MKKFNFLFVGMIFIFFVFWKAAEMKKNFLFSEVQGRVLWEGQPVANAIIEREYHWHWKDERGKDSATSNQKGEFHFPEITGVSISGLLIPHEPMIKQTLTIHHENKIYKAWAFDKGNYERFGELKGRPLILQCDLSREPQRDIEHGFFGHCVLAPDK